MESSGREGHKLDRDYSRSLRTSSRHSRAINPKGGAPRLQGVYETGEVYLVGSELAQLDDELTGLDASGRRRFQVVPTRKRMSTERKMKTILLLDAEGVANERIADRLSLSKRQVQKRRPVRRSQRPRKPRRGDISEGAIKALPA
jgi:hypothetical protein